MYVWLAAEGQAAADRIVSVALAQDQGLFNPYTLGGTIVVDGVVASAHSSWVLDGLFAALGLDIPAAYQVIYTAAAEPKHVLQTAQPKPYLQTVKHPIPAPDAVLPPPRPVPCPGS